MSLDQLHLLPPENQTAILEGPALKPPSDLLYNLDDPPNGNGVAFAAITICVTVATLAAILRAYSKILVTRNVVLEDYIAFALTIPLVYCGYRLLHGVGFFVHQWNVRVKDLAEVLWVSFKYSDLDSTNTGA
ncbi:hypothetical protein DL769_003376 [Monosporascus sp. CRB-8-3]|nr:hypothetical protein DL769_003376 [Monosporascus sp. CRB-8-3]